MVPIGSMYAIYGNIYHQYTPYVSIYTIHGSYGVRCLVLIVTSPHMVGSLPLGTWDPMKNLIEQSHHIPWIGWLNPKQSQLNPTKSNIPMIHVGGFNPSEKSWTTRQLGWLIIRNFLNGKSHQIPWFQSPPRFPWCVDYNVVPPPVMFIGL